MYGLLGLLRLFQVWVWYLDGFFKIEAPVTRRGVERPPPIEAPITRRGIERKRE